ncbi:hypothetical protein INT44_005502 [Umbelopsis vinacea]|uniref:Rad60/SUMO-like domain-containing protein n=1 Tax=Umbelopsis vinacea TaxID=44442 RepID=A0A8H7Q870_9FUNG|nr:hypothetical protein INT44_005502 [Umbelopsis vinacea]
MSDFDITTFRSKSKKTGKKTLRRNPSSVATSFTKYLEKRKELGLDDSDEDAEEVDVKRKSQKFSETSHPSEPEPTEKTQSSGETARSAEGPTVVMAAASIETEKNAFIILDSDDDDQPAKAPPAAVKSPVETAHETSMVEKPKEIESQKEPSSLSLLDDFDDLDPDLASSLMESPPDRSLQETSIHQLPANKIALKFQMRLYPVIETPLAPDLQVLIKVLKVYVLDRDTLEQAFNAFVRHKKLEGSNLVFIYNNAKVWPIATPVNLGMQVEDVNNIGMYRSLDGKQYRQAELESEKQSRQERLAQMRPEEELSDDEIEIQGGSTQPPEEDNGLFLKIRVCPSHSDPIQTTTIGALLKHYRSLNNLGDIPVKLMWDDDVLAESQQVQDTDLEDEDMISATW